jgi:ABC-2 type transport system permease protein
MATIFAIAVKDLRLLWRDKAGLFWVIGFPMLMALFFGSIFSGNGDTQGAMRIGVVDSDHSDYSRGLITDLKKSDALSIRELPLDSARQMVRLGKLAAYLEIKKGMGTSDGFAAASDSTGLEIGIDPSRKAEAGYLEGLIAQAYFQHMQELFTDPSKLRAKIPQWTEGVAGDSSLSSKQRAGYEDLFSGLDQFLGAVDTSKIGTNSIMGGPPLKKVDIVNNQIAPHSSYEITFPAAILWALIGCCASFAVSIVAERTRGTFLRLRLAPISRTQILAGKGLACFTASILVSFLLLAVAATVFQVRLTNPIGLAVALVSAAICFVGLMMLISVLGRTEQAVGGAGWAILLIMSMTGGGMIPLFAMPGWMQTVSNFSAVKWGILAIEGAIWRQFTFSEMLFPVAVLLVVGVLAFSIGATILTRAET